MSTAVSAEACLLTVSWQLT